MSSGDVPRSRFRSCLGLLVWLWVSFSAGWLLNECEHQAWDAAKAVSVGWERIRGAGRRASDLLARWRQSPVAQPRDGLGESAGPDVSSGRAKATFGAGEPGSRDPEAPRVAPAQEEARKSEADATEVKTAKAPVRDEARKGEAAVAEAKDLMAQAQELNQPAARNEKLKAAEERLEAARRHFERAASLAPEDGRVQRLQQETMRLFYACRKLRGV